MKFKRVLHVVGGMNRAGAETMLMNLYREIDRSKYQFDFLYFTNERCDYDNEIELLGGRIIRVTSYNSVCRFFSLFGVFKKGSWDIVHAHTLFSSGLHLLAAKLAGIPMLIAHSHSTSDTNTSNVIGRIYHFLMRWLLLWVPTDHAACGKTAADYLFPRSANVKIIPNAINISLFVSAEDSLIRQELGINQNKLIILQIGRLMPVKNHIYSVKIAAALRDTGVDFKMLFVGTGPEKKAIEAIISQYELEDHVFFLGLRADIPELMALADVMLMPSLHEGFPVVLVESQAAGLPAVISSRVSSEVDMGIGLVKFVDLDITPKEWSDKIQIAVKKEKVSIESRIKALELKGFSACAGAKLLLAIYDKVD